MPEGKSEIPDDIKRAAYNALYDAIANFRDKTPYDWDKAVAIIAMAIIAERETCAKIAEARKPLYGLEGSNACSEIASSILHRGALNHD